MKSFRGLQLLEVQTEEQTLVQNEERSALEQLEYLLAQSSSVVYSCKAESPYAAIYVSQNVKDLTGFEPQDFIKTPSFWADRIHPDDQPLVFQNISLIFEQGTSVHEYRWRKKDGQYIWFRDALRLVKDDNGNPLEIVGTWYDVSHDKNSKELMRVTQFAIDHVGVSVFWIYPDARFAYVNAAACKSLGYTCEELLQMTVFDIDPHFPQNMWTEHWQEIRERGSFVIESIHRSKDGQDYPVEISVNYLCHGTQEFNCAFARDISERKQMEEELSKNEQKLRNIVEHSNELFYIHDDRHKFFYVSPQSTEIFGYTPEEMMIEWTTLVTDNPVNEIGYQLTEKALKTGERQELYRLELYRKDKQRIWLEIDESPLKDEAGNVIGIIGAARDITDYKHTEEEMKKLSTAIEQATDWVIMTDKQGNIVYANKIVEDISGYKREELINQNPKIFKSGKHDETFYKELWDTILSGNSFRGILTNRKKDGGLFYIDHTITPLKDKEGNITNFLSTGKDITQEKILEEKINFLAYYYALTGLPNRSLFIDRLNQAIARAAFKKKLVAVLILGIDRFKMVNDSYGPEVGDEVLKEVARRLLHSTREGDTVSRLRSDEFGILLTDIARSEDTILITEKVMRNISEIISVNDAEIVITPSIGITMHPNDGDSAEVLIQNAYIAHSKAYEQGGNSYQFYAPGMNVKATEFMLMESHLFNALKNDEFILYYQPYFDIPTEKIAGMEALIRWQSKDMGLVSPGKFIPVLEETGMIKDVGNWIIQEACRQIREWDSKGYSVVPVSVNISSVQFKQKEFFEKIDWIVKESGIPPELLVLEITESAFMQDIEFTTTMLRTMREKGYAISIDDFGTGYSSLKYLKMLPVDKLKIDISFISEIVEDPDSASIVTAIISMAHSLGLQTIAEGVETEEQWRILRILRCDLVQGFYKSHPLNPSEVEKFLNR